MPLYIRSVPSFRAVVSSQPIVEARLWDYPHFVGYQGWGKTACFCFPFFPASSPYNIMGVPVNSKKL